MIRIKRIILQMILIIILSLTILPVYSYNYPPIVTDNTNLLIPQIRFHQNSESATFCFVTDLHNRAFGTSYDENNAIINVIKHIVQGSNIINDSVKINTIVVGGDYLWNNGSTSKQLAFDALHGFSKAMHEAKSKPLLILKGNHDDNSMGALSDMLSPEVFYKNCPQSFECSEVVTDPKNPSGCYGYYDIKPQKIRIIYLNSVDIPWIEEGGSVRYKGQGTCGVQQAQLNFVANALHFKESGWGVVFVSHHSIALIQDFATELYSSYIPANNGGSQLLGIIEAFKNKTTFSGTLTGDFASVVNVDFTKNQSDEVICLLSGHTHSDRNAVKDNMLFLSTTTATQNNTFQNTDGSIYTPTANTKDESAADYITIDRRHGIVYLDRYGFGVSRKFKYKGDVGSIINKYGLIYIVDGKVYKFIDVDYKAAITPEVEPRKEGYTFSGWSEIPRIMPANDVIVTGSFSINKYKLTYMVDGEIYKSYDIEYGSTITPEAVPTKKGYTFSGWSEIPQTMPANDVTITGSYTRNEYEVGGVIYVINENSADIVKAECNTDEVVVEATVSIDGKTYNVIAIDEGAYQDCSKITSLTIADGIQFIMANAFNGCIGLKTLKISNSIKYIGTMAFANIGINAEAFTRASDESLIVECHTDEIPETEIDCFEGTYVEASTLLVDDELVDNYKTTLPWSMFGTIMGINEYKSGIKTLSADHQRAAIFSIDGRRLDKPQKGINIIQTSQDVRKILAK